MGNPKFPRKIVLHDKEQATLWLSFQFFSKVATYLHVKIVSKQVVLYNITCSTSPLP
jgi:hypothetical protein